MTKAVFFGASSVEGAGASSPEKRFTSLICRTLGWEEINLGVGGTTMTGRDDSGLIVDEESGIGRVPDVLHAAPNFVIISFGANDFAQSRSIGELGKFQQGTFVSDYDTVVRGLIENLPDAKIVLATCQYRADGEILNELGFTLEDYNQAIRQIAERYKLELADAYTGSGIDSHNFTAFSADAAHLNDEGYQRLAGFFIECLTAERCG
ncbi:MAG: SGNH/GDSL hydrolase family protein [Janthinobacterium lividum]